MCRRLFRVQYPSDVKNFCSKSCMSRHARFVDPPHQDRANSPEARAKKSAAVSGEKHPMYGRAPELNPAYIHGRAVGKKPARRWRGDTCIDCGSRRADGARIVAHHRDKNRRNNTRENIATLCQPCHNRRHARDRRGEANTL
jgi:hypothetical protein